MLFFTPYNFFVRTIICWVSFFIDAGKRSPSGIILYTTFLYFFKMLIIVSSFISIWIGFNPPTTSKSCCALIIACFCWFRHKSFLSFSEVCYWKMINIFITGFYFWTVYMCFSCKFKFVLKDFFSIKNFKRSFVDNNVKFLTAVFPEK